MELTAVHKSALAFIDSYRSKLTEISQELFDNPEIAYQEKFASNLLVKEVKALGFQVEKPVCNLETAFIAKKTSKKPGPSVAILAEYDALPGIGHGCGHNLIATASLGGAAAVAHVIEEIGGTIYLYGTPAEEAGGGKVSFCKMNAFDNIDGAILGHPSAEGETWAFGKTSLCVNSLWFHFTGKTAHAAMDPHLGVNALDGVIHTFNSINALRQQIRPDARVHGIITEGGKAPNIIPDKASAHFYVRAQDKQYTEELTERVINCAKGAALATGASVQIKKNQGYYDVIPVNAFTKEFAKVLDTLHIPYKKNPGALPASTDLGNVSHIVPTLGFDFSIVKPKQSITGHSKELADQTLTSRGQEGMVLAAKANALFAIRLLTHPQILENARKELTEKTG